MIYMKYTNFYIKATESNVFLITFFFIYCVKVNVFWLQKMELYFKNQTKFDFGAS